MQAFQFSFRMFVELLSYVFQLLLSTIGQLKILQGVINDSTDLILDSLDIPCGNISDGRFGSYDADVHVLTIGRLADKHDAHIN